MFDNGHQIFDITNKIHHPYFITLNILQKNLHFSKFSYKTENMKNFIVQMEKKHYNIWQILLRKKFL